MMKIYMFLAMVSILLVGSTAFASLEDIMLLEKRICKVDAGGDITDANERNPFKLERDRAAALIAGQREDGTWADVEYESNLLGNWKPGQGHLRERVLFLARDYYHSRDLRSAAAVKKGLNYWVKAKHLCRNWWWNEIGAPLDFGVAALFVDDVLTDAERKCYADYLECSQIRMTGQNRVWLSRAVMMRAILRRDEALLDKAVAAIAAEVKISDGPEGIADDWSFRQHGPQLQFGNYGLSYLLNQARFANAFATTKWEYPKDKLNIIGNLAEKGFLWTVWRDMMDVSCLGRQIGPGRQQDKAEGLKIALDELRAAGWQFPPPPIGLRFFPKGAYGVYRTDNWMASVKMTTSEVLETESWINGENTLGGHLSDGALFIYVTGHEYEDIFPLWKNWRFIPGITSYADLPPVQSCYHVSPKANEVNEMTATEDSISFRLVRDGLEARKQWKFLADRIVCTGDGITSTNRKTRVTTCVEHALAADDVKILTYKDGKLTVVNGAIKYHIYAPESQIVARVEERSGDYRGLWPATAEVKKTGKVLLVYIDHGVAPSNATYHYEVEICK